MFNTKKINGISIKSFVIFICKNKCRPVWKTDLYDDINFFFIFFFFTTFYSLS